MYGRRHNKRNDKVKTQKTIVSELQYSNSSSVQNMEVDNTVISIQVLREVTNNFRKKKKNIGEGSFHHCIYAKENWPIEQRLRLKGCNLKWLETKG
jgi:predicted nucleic acid-binding protein